MRLLPLSLLAGLALAVGPAVFGATCEPPPGETLAPGEPGSAGQALAWDGLAEADSYQIEREGELVAETPASRCWWLPWRGPLDGQAATYRVRACNLDGCGGFSGPVSVPWLETACYEAGLEVPCWAGAAVHDPDPPCERFGNPDADTYRWTRHGRCTVSPFAGCDVGRPSRIRAPSNDVGTYQFVVVADVGGVPLDWLWVSSPRARAEAWPPLRFRSGETYWIGWCAWGVDGEQLGDQVEQDYHYLDGGEAHYMTVSEGPFPPPGGWWTDEIRPRQLTIEVERLGSVAD